MSKELRNKIIRLAHSNPELRKDLLPLLSKTAKSKFKKGDTVKYKGKECKVMEVASNGKVTIKSKGRGGAVKTFSAKDAEKQLKTAKTKDRLVQSSRYTTFGGSGKTWSADRKAVELATRQGSPEDWGDWSHLEFFIEDLGVDVNVLNCQFQPNPKLCTWEYSKSGMRGEWAFNLVGNLLWTLELKVEGCRSRKPAQIEQMNVHYPLDLATYSSLDTINPYK